MPGPTLRCTEGDLLRIRFINGSAHPHTVHFHGLHPSAMDGVPGAGPGIIEPGGSTVYEFNAEPFGLHLYHCHVSPLAEHIARGMYGTFIVDPKEGREDADELVMVQNGWNTTFDAEGNQLYAVNAIPFHYVNEPIKVARDELVRIYLVNILEYDPINSFHIHGNFFNHFPTGTSLTPTEFTDTIIQGQAQRGILEMKFPYPGEFMFHAHKTEFADLGWMGFFEVSEVTERVPLWALAGGVIALIAVVLVTIAVIGDDTLPDRAGPPIEELAVEKTKLEPNQIELTVRNTGPDEVRGRPGVRGRRVRRLRRRRGANRPARVRDDHDRLPVAGRSAVSGLDAHLDRPRDRSRDRRRGRDAGHRRRPVRADGAPGPLRGRHPRDARDAPPAGDEALSPDLDPRRHGRDGRASSPSSRWTRASRDSRSPASRAARSAAPSWCCSERASPSWR